MKQSVFFENIGHRKIFQVFTEPDIPTKKVVIMSHGFRGTSVGPARIFVDFEKLLLKNGFAVLRYDQPCSGNSSGDYIDSSFDDWVNTTNYLVEKFIENNYQVVLLGQSMGATNSMIVAGQEKLRDQIPCVLLWVPDPKSEVNVNPQGIYEEGGQKYKGSFWIEAKNHAFFDALSAYTGGIHLVYGETDKYISNELRQQTIDAVIKKGQPYMILKGQDHSPWEFDLVQHVYSEELTFLEKIFHNNKNKGGTYLL